MLSVACAKTIVQIEVEEFSPSIFCYNFYGFRFLCWSLVYSDFLLKNVVSLVQDVDFQFFWQNLWNNLFLSLWQSCQEVQTCFYRLCFSVPAHRYLPMCSLVDSVGLFVFMLLLCCVCVLGGCLFALLNLTL